MVSKLNTRYSSILSDIDVIDGNTAVTLILPKIECGAHHGSIILIGANGVVQGASD